jgi:hypothetical protein
MSATTPRQYGGNTPPPGYVQFLVERIPDWWTDTRPSAGMIPCLVWVNPVLTPFTVRWNNSANPCSHGYRVSEETAREMAPSIRHYPLGRLSLLRKDHRMSGYLPDGLTAAERDYVYGDQYEEREDEEMEQETMPEITCDTCGAPHPTLCCCGPEASFGPTPAPPPATGPAEAPAYSGGSAGPFSLEELRRLEKEATAGPWHDAGNDVRNEHDQEVAECATKRQWEPGYGPIPISEVCANAALIVAMRNALPAILAAIEQARTHLRVALLQQHPSDDQIIMGHVRDALAALEGRGK